MPQTITRLSGITYLDGFTVDPAANFLSCGANPQRVTATSEHLGWSNDDLCPAYANRAGGAFNRVMVNPPPILVRSPSNELFVTTPPTRASTPWTVPERARDHFTGETIIAGQYVSRYDSQRRSSVVIVAASTTIRVCDNCGLRQRAADFPSPTANNCATCTGAMETNYSVEWHPGEPIIDRRADLLGSNRKFGIELEIVHAPGFRTLRDRKWGAHRDGSVNNGIEIVSPIMQGNAGVAEVDHVGELARNRAWRVDRRCGFHVHLDVSQHDTNGIYRICSLYRHLQWFLFFLVDIQRRDSSYTKPWTADIDPLLADCRTAAGFVKFTAHPMIRDRYHILNADSVRKHGSLEVRLHHGTTNRDKIYHWVRLHAHLFDWAVKSNPERVAQALALGKTIPTADKVPAAVSSIWDVLANRIPDDTAAFYLARAAELHQFDLKSGTPTRPNPDSIPDPELCA